MTPDDKDWRNYVAEKLRETDQRVAQLADELTTNTKLTAQLVADSRTLSEEDMNKVAEKAATAAVEKITDQTYRAIGRTVLNKFTVLIGALIVGVVLYLVSKGVLKP